MAKPNHNWISIQPEKIKEERNRWYNNKTVHRLFIALIFLTAAAIPLAFYIWPSMPWLLPAVEGPIYFFPRPSDLIPLFSDVIPCIPLALSLTTYYALYLDNPEKTYLREMEKETQHFLKLKQKVVNAEDKKLLAKLENLLNKSAYPEFNSNIFKNDASIDTLKTLKWARMILEEYVLAKSKSAEEQNNIHRKIDHTLLLLKPGARTLLIAREKQRHDKYRQRHDKYIDKCEKEREAKEIFNHLKL